ncbi:GGDEF domain-containing protein [Jidongwangia harbinensis]|uniref:GGDEF domain-containing protein n=1 Tax=Jidongwangia harbinensis TaxID=2878561 RepID=UPI001CD9F142|nr:GGDEF domain-containing protein [Jidongwangia harbinensis]MCA2219407.1 GGDEF domain-containing protein [Jidongwangia harbinensis]
MPPAHARPARRPVALIPFGAVVLGLPTVLRPGSTLAQVTYTVTFCLFVVLAWAGVRAQPRGRPAYALVAGGLTAWLAGDLLYALLTRVFGEFDGVSPGDVLWIAGYPLIATGLLLMTRLRAAGRLRESLLDGLAMATVVASLFGQFLVLPAVVGEGFTLDVLTGAFYPFGDVLLFAAAVLLVLAPGDRRGPTRYLVAALTLTFLGDVVITVLSERLPEFDTARLDAVLLLANGLLVAALRHPRAGQLTAARAADERLHPARVVFLGIAMLAMPALTHLRVSATAAERWASLTATVILSVIVLIRFTLVVRDQERVRATLAHRATHDRMTGLVNRSELHARLDLALRRDPPAGLLAVYLDLDGFKSVNDRYGHAAGDAVLVEVAARLRATLRPADTVARVGGDEFVVVPADVHDARSAAALAARLDRIVRTPVRYRDAVLEVGVSIGTAFAGDLDRPDVDALLAAADAAMYRTKAVRRAAAPTAAPAPVS